MPILDSEFKELIGDTDRLIMSDELEVDFGELEEDTQTLIIDSADIDFVCNLLNVSSSINQDAKNRFWTFKIEVPGLSFSDLVDATKIKYQYNDNVFESVSTFSWDLEDAGSILTFAAIRILNNYESK